MTPFHDWPEGCLDPAPAPAGRVDCWAVSFAALPASAEARLASCLAPDERQRASRFRFARDRTLYVVSHAALRILLARHLGLAPDTLAFRQEAGGRPVLAQPAAGLHFSISHSGEAALVALSSDAPVGVDLEQVRDVDDYAAIACRFFSPDEAAALASLPAERRLAGFFVTWTRKEAFVKALGLGLSHPLDAFSTGPPGRPPALKGWTITDAPLNGGYCGAVAIQRPSMPVRYRQATWPLLAAHLGATGLAVAPADPAPAP